VQAYQSDPEFDCAAEYHSVLDKNTTMYEVSSKIPDLQMNKKSNQKLFAVCVATF
jgi:hypothetical protein